MDFVTNLGFGRDGKARDNVPNIGRGPTRVTTDLYVMRPDPDANELTVTSLHPGVSGEGIIAATGWDICLAGQLATTSEPGGHTLEARTEKHHGDHR